MVELEHNSDYRYIPSTVAPSDTSCNLNSVVFPLTNLQIRVKHCYETGWVLFLGWD